MPAHRNPKITAIRLALGVNRKRAYQILHKSLGLCAYCSDTATHGVCCAKHYESNRAIQEFYRRDAGMKINRCSKCGEPGHNRKSCDKAGKP